MGTISGCWDLNVNLKAKMFLSVNSTSQRCSTKIIKIFMIEDFSICHRCQWHRWWTLSCEYLREFSKKFQTALMVYSGAWRKLNHEKTRSRKISWHCPFKLNGFINDNTDSDTHHFYWNLSRVLTREYWMIYRGPGFLVVLWFDSSPTLPSASYLSFSVFLCVISRAYWGGKGVGEKPIYRTERKPDPLPIKHSIFYGSADEQRHVKNVTIFFDEKVHVRGAKQNLWRYYSKEGCVFSEVQMGIWQFFQFPILYLYICLFCLWGIIMKTSTLLYMENIQYVTLS